MYKRQIKKTVIADPTAVTPDVVKSLGQLQNNSAIIKTLKPALQQNILHAFVQSFHVVFLAAAPVTALGLIFAFMLKETPLRSGAEHHAAKTEAAGEAIA